MADDTTDPNAVRLRAAKGLFLSTGGIVVLFLTAIGLALWGAGQSQGAFWFIGLLVVVVMTLATAAAIFSGLSLADAGEAFGLPSGSVRALLAVGIMVLLVVFGLKQLDSPPARLGATPTMVSVSQDKLAAALVQYKAQEFTAVVTDFGRAADPANKVLETPAKVALFRTVSGQDSETKDLAKQILTGVLTLLTTIIGFYFGSRSATDGMRRDDAPPDIGPLVDLACQRKVIGTEFAALDAGLQVAQHQIEQARTATPSTDPAVKASREALQQAADDNLDAVKSARDALSKGLADADAALAALRSATGDAAKLQQTAATTALKTATDSFAKLRLLAATLADQAKQLTPPS